MKTTNALLKLLISELQQKSVDKIPAGWFNKEEIMKETNVSFSTAKNWIKKSIANEIVEVKKFKRLSKDGRVILITYYKKK